jgi:hypothetical protein
MLVRMGWMIDIYLFHIMVANEVVGHRLGREGFLGRVACTDLHSSSAGRDWSGVGASVILRGSSAYRHTGGGVQAFFNCTGGVGGHGTLTREMVLIGVG